MHTFSMQVGLSPIGCGSRFFSGHHPIDFVQRDPKVDIHGRYELRILGSTIASLLLLLAVILWWPLPDDDVPDTVFDARGKEVVQLKEIAQTRHAEHRKPPPPVPQPPIPVPDDVLLSEEVIELIEFNPDDAPADAGDAPPAESGDEGPMLVARAEQAPRPLKYVEPEYTPEARKNRIRAEIVVKVLVDESGRVLESEIVEMFLLGEKGMPKKPVDKVGYGLEEAALSAADRWRFRPAQHQGRIVRSYQTLTFTFDT